MSAIHNDNIPTTAAPVAAEPQRTGTWKISFASCSAIRRHFYPSANPYAPAVPGNARADLDMQTQFNNAKAEAVAFHNNKWAPMAKKNIERTEQEEKHYLKILIATALKRQSELNSNKLSSTILSKCQGRVAAAGPNGSTKAKEVTEERAYDLSYVAKKMEEDIDIVYRRYGYKVTLQALTTMRPWDI